MPLLDQFGRPVTAVKNPILDEIAVQTVRDRYSSNPSSGLTPQRLASILKEADDGDVYRQAELMEEFEEKWPALQADLQTRKLAVAGLTWEIEPASESSEDKKIAEAAKEMLEYIEDFERALFDSLDAVAKGFAVQEIFWEIAGSEVWVKRLKWVHQKRFTFYSQEQVLEFPRLLTDAEPALGEELQPFKFLFHRHLARSGAAPRGGLARPLAYLYLFTNFSLKDWVIFNDLYSVPMRVGKYKPGATTGEIDALKQAVFNLGTDAAAVVSDSTLIELLETKNRAGDIPTFKAFIDWSARMVSKVVLGHTGASEPTPGKLGGEDAAQEVRQDLVEHDARSLQNAIKFQLIWPWVVYQFGADKACPKFQFHYEAEEDLNETATMYGTLVEKVGFRKIGVQHIYERFGIPEPAAGEETLQDIAREAQQEMQTAETQATAVARRGEGAGKTQRQANKAAQSGEWRVASGEKIAQDALDGLKDGFTDAALQSQMEAALKPVFELIQNGASYTDVMARLASLAPDLETEQMEKLIAKAVFVAETWGRLTAVTSDK